VQERGAVVVYDVSSTAAEPAEDGIRVLAVGYGTDAKQAVGEAAFIWTTGVFTAVRHWLAPQVHTCFADDAHMLVRAIEPDEEFGWRVHQGPILSRTFGKSDADESPEVEAQEIFETLFDEIHPLSAHRNLFWIEAFAVRYPDGRADATCRLRNDDWPEGKDALLLYASSWEVPEGIMLSRRQFLLFEPISPNAVPDRAKMTRKLDAVAGAPKPWWRRLFG
jgi:hypothetical protein